MKALATLRHLTILLVFALAASTVSAADGAKKARKTNAKPAVERAATAQRRIVAAFVDPTAPLAEMVERVRTERAAQDGPQQ